MVRCSAVGRCTTLWRCTTLLTALLLLFPFFLLSFSISCNSSISNFPVVLIIWSDILIFVLLSCVPAGFARVCEFNTLLSLVRQWFSLLCYNCATLLWSFLAFASLFIFKLFALLLEPSFEYVLKREREHFFKSLRCRRIYRGIGVNIWFFVRIFRPASRHGLQNKQDQKENIVKLYWSHEKWMKRRATKLYTIHAMTPNSLEVLKSYILDENYVTVMHVPLSTPVENT